MKIHENRAKNGKKNFAEMWIFGFVICAISVGIFANVRNFANAEKAENVEIAQDYTVKKLDFINFDGKSYVKTKIDQVGDTKVAVDFQLENRGSVPMVFGARSTVGANPQDNFNLILDPNTTTFRADYGDSFGDNSWGNNNYIFVFSGDTDHSLRKKFEMDNNNVSLSDVGGDFSQTGTINNAAPDVPYEFYLGASNQASGVAGAFMVGKIYSFQIWKNGNLVLNLVPAARFVCDSTEVEYGFANDLDGDGNFANDEWFGNSGSGILTGSEEVLAEKCPEIPEEKPTENPETPEENNENSRNDPENPAKISAPNTGIKSEK